MVNVKTSIHNFTKTELKCLDKAECTMLGAIGRNTKHKQKLAPVNRWIEPQKTHLLHSLDSTQSEQVHSIPNTSAVCDNAKLQAFKMYNTWIHSDIHCGAKNCSIRLFFQ